MPLKDKVGITILKFTNYNEANKKMLHIKHTSIEHSEKVLEFKNEALDESQKQLNGLNNVHNAMMEKNAAMEARVNELYEVIVYMREVLPKGL